MMDNNLFVLCRKLGQLCDAKETRIALAESCTGGMLSSLLTEVAGSSSWFNGAAIVYSNLAKENILGVDQNLIISRGAVSEDVAKAMAQGALEKLHADLAMSITGIAGPSGGTKEKPVGMVCFALADKKDGVQSKTMHFTGGRANVRRCACLFVLDWLMMHLSIQ